MSETKPLNEDGREMCDAKRAGRDGNCESPFVMQNGRCRIHGGASPAPGPLHPAYKHGRYSRTIPGKLRERYENQLNDKELLGLHDEVALVGSMLDEQVAAMDTGETGQLLVRLRALCNEFTEHTRKGERAEAQEKHMLIFKLIRSGAQEWQRRAEIVRLAHDRRKLAESERKHLVEAKLMLTVEQAMTMSNILLDIIKRHVPEPERRLAIGKDVEKLMNVPESESVS